jgi:hypothetical protein
MIRRDRSTSAALRALQEATVPVPSAPSVVGSDSRLLALARHGRRLTPAALAVVVALVFWVLSNLVAGALTEDPTTGAAALSALALAPALMVGYGLRMALLWGWIARYEGRGFRTFGFERTAGATRFLRGFLLGLVLFSAVTAVLVATGLARPERGTASMQGLAALGGVLIMLVGWLVQGSAEEVMFRGFLLQSFGARRLVWLGVAVQAVLFAAGHVSAWGSPVALLNLVLFAVFAAAYALREGGLWGVCGFHVAWNWTQGNLTGLAVSGHDVPGGTLLNLTTVGSPLLAGGRFGVEASIVVTVALAVAIAVTLTRRAKPAPAGGQVGTAGTAPR